MDHTNDNDGLSPTTVAMPAEFPPQREGTANALSMQGPQSAPVAYGLHRLHSEICG